VLLPADFFDHVPTTEVTRLDERVPEISSCQISDRGTGLSFEPELETPPMR
jgi:hypothetical protein